MALRETSVETADHQMVDLATGGEHGFDHQDRIIVGVGLVEPGQKPVLSLGSVFCRDTQHAAIG